MIAKLVNFAVLVGALVYFLKAPIAGYLAGRSAQIRQDLVTAAEMRKTATAQLEEIDRSWRRCRRNSTRSRRVVKKTWSRRRRASRKRPPPNASA